jgi:hypothetical protein
MKTPILTRRRLISLGTAVIAAATTQAQVAKKARRIATPPPVKPPLQSADITKLPQGTRQLDLFLLMGQSNMKGRGVMPDEPQSDPRIVMMHLKDDQWYLARHPVHLTGDAQTFIGHDNAGVGPALAFAGALLESNPGSAIGLVPCAVGGSPIKLWQKGAKLYEEALRRAKLAIQTASSVNARVRGILWLQGEADAKPAELAVHEGKLLKLVDDLRADLDAPDLPFIACTIGEMGDASKMADKMAMNQILLALPQKRPNTACVDARDLKTHIGDSVHFDTAAQEEIGRRFAKQFGALQ